MGFQLKGLGPDWDKGNGLKGERIQVMCLAQPTLVIATAHNALLTSTTLRCMHFVYAINSASRRPSVPNMSGTDDEIEIRFDLVGAHHLNWAGTLYLADGNSSETYEITLKSFHVPLKPHWHWLTAAIPVDAGGGSTRYRIPDWHSMASGSTETGLTPYRVGPFRGAIGTMQTPLPPQRNIELFPTNAMTFASGWYG